MYMQLDVVVTLWVHVAFFSLVVRIRIRLLIIASLYNAQYKI
jgi:hypothetical protein